MSRGTSPIITCEFPFDVSTLSYAYFTIAQNERIMLNKKIECEGLEGRQIKIHLTQEETLKLKENLQAEAQVRGITRDGEAIASDIIKIYVDKILKDGVI